MKIIKKSLLTICILALTICINSQNNQVLAANTAVMSAYPATGSYSVGTNFNIAIVVDGGGQTFNAAQAKIALTNLTVQSIQPGTCNFTYTQTPTVLNTSFAGAILGGSTTNCTVLTMTVSTLTAGNASLTFNTPEVVSDDGNGTLILQTVNNGAYTIISNPTPTPTVVASTAPTTAPTKKGNIPTSTPKVTTTPLPSVSPTVTPSSIPSLTPTPTPSPTRPLLVVSSPTSGGSSFFGQIVDLIKYGIAALIGFLIRPSSLRFVLSKFHPPI